MVVVSDRVINIQDAFLNYMRKNKVPVTVFLLNGVKLYGVISCFDQKAVVIKREGRSQLVYKHAISTYSPHGKITVFDWNGAPAVPGGFSKDRPSDEGEDEEYGEYDDEGASYDDEEYSDEDEVAGVEAEDDEEDNDER
jgi:host factor-I protein